MIQIHKVYTKTGDGGKTAIIGGGKVYKNDIKVECYGTIDELQSFVGLLRAEFIEHQSVEKINYYFQQLDEIQNCLFDLGSILATSPKAREKREMNFPVINIQNLEKWIDEESKGLDPLNSFILSGGGIFSARAHVIRTVCRRAERQVFSLSQQEVIPSELLCYLNRLSDYFFVLARSLAKFFKEDEPLWRTPLKDSDS